MSLLVYEKKVDGVRHLFGTFNSIPGPDDHQLSYVDENKDTVEVSLTNSYFDAGQGRIKDANGTIINVVLDDTVIIPKGGEMPKSNKCVITSFKIGDATGTINNTAIAVTVPKDTVVTALEPTIVVSTGASVVPASGTATDFTNPVSFVVTAEDGKTTKTYTVTVTVAAE